LGAKLRLLLEAGADLEEVDDDEWTPLLESAMSGQPAAFDALLAAGACTSALLVNVGLSAVGVYMTVLHKHAMDDDPAMIQRVLATGALDVDVRSGPAEGCLRRTPLVTAAVWDAPLAVGALLAAGASRTATDAMGVDALHAAINAHSAKAARLLVAATPRAAQARYKRAAVCELAVCEHDAAARPGCVTRVARLAAAWGIVTLLA